MTDTSDSSTNHTILCGLCNAPIGYRVETDPDGEAGCSACDNWANKDEVIKIACNYPGTKYANFLLRKQHLDLTGHNFAVFDPVWVSF